MKYFLRDNHISNVTNAALLNLFSIMDIVIKTLQEFR